MSATPKTDATQIEVLHHDALGGGWMMAVPAEFARKLELENAQLRAGCSAIATAIGNGSAASPEASVEFLTTALALEVRLYCEALRRENARLTPDAGEAQ